MSARDVSAKAVADDLNERAEGCTAEAAVAAEQADRWLADAADLRAEADRLSALADRIAHLDTPAGAGAAPSTPPEPASDEFASNVAAYVMSHPEAGSFSAYDAAKKAVEVFLQDETASRQLIALRPSLAAAAALPAPSVPADPEVQGGAS